MLGVHIAMLGVMETRSASRSADRRGSRDLRVREGLLMAAAGTGDAVQLERAWQQVCACIGGEDDTELRALYERLRRDVHSVGVGNGRARATRDNPVRVSDS